MVMTAKEKFLRQVRESRTAVKRMEEKAIKDRTMPGFIALHKSKGQHWFDRDTIDFFKSRFGPMVKGRYFISSEKGWQVPRKWTIRKVNWKTANVSTVGEFGAFKTEAQAKKKLKDLI